MLKYFMDNNENQKVEEIFTKLEEIYKIADEISKILKQKFCD